jgi:hypothetical protein
VLKENVDECGKNVSKNLLNGYLSKLFPAVLFRFFDWTCMFSFVLPKIEMSKSAQLSLVDSRREMLYQYSNFTAND